MCSRPILLVTAHPERREQLSNSLANAGYQVRAAASGDEALQAAADQDLRLVLLDPRLADTDPVTFCRALRRQRFVPVLVIDHEADSVDRVVVLEAGADDFVARSISQRELLARIKALLRRVELTRREQRHANSKAPHPRHRFQFGNLIIDEERHEVRLDNQLLNLRPREYELLHFFARHRGVTLSREEIFQQVWRESSATTRRTVDVHVRWLRQKIEPDPGNARRIIAVRGVGYRFEG